jgi:hypothetical protein
MHMESTNQKKHPTRNRVRFEGVVKVRIRVRVGLNNNPIKKKKKREREGPRRTKRGPQKNKDTQRPSTK